MKKKYLPLAVEVAMLADEDVLRTSPETDDVLLPEEGAFGGGSDENGWT